MKTEDIIALAKAGFSKDQIEAINKAMRAEPEPTPAPQPQQEPEPTPALQPQQEPEPKPVPQPQDDPILQELLGIKTLLQKQNIKNDGYGNNPEKSVDDILASMIAPPKQKGGK